MSADLRSAEIDIDKLLSRPRGSGRATAATERSPERYRRCPALSGPGPPAGPPRAQARPGRDQAHGRENVHELRALSAPPAPAGRGGYPPPAPPLAASP